MVWFFFLIGFAVLSLAFVLWASFRRRTKIPSMRKQHLREAWNEMLEMHDPARRVLEAEKVCDAVLQALDYHGTFAEKLKAAAPRLSNVDDLWNAHRLRNRLAHEVHARVSDAQSDRALQAYASIVHQFLG